MAWFGDTFGDGLSSLKGQISKITKEVLSEDPLAVTSYEGKINDLEEQVRVLTDKLQQLQSADDKLADYAKQIEALNNSIQELDAEHELALQIVVEERDHLRRLLNSSQWGDTELNVGDTSNHSGDGEGDVKPLAAVKSAEIKSLNTRIDQQQKKITESQRENAKLRQELSAVSAELTSNHEILQDFNDRLEKYEQEIKIVNEKLLEKENEVDSLNMQLSELNAVLDNARYAESQLEKAESVITNLMEEVDSSKDIQAAFELLSLENLSLKERVENLEGQSEAAEAQPGPQQIQEVKPDKRIIDLEDELNTLREELAANQIELSSYVEEIKLLREKLSIKDQGHAEHDQQLTDIQGLSESAIKETDHVLNEKIKTLQAELLESKNECLKISESRDDERLNFFEEVEGLKKKLDNATAKVAASENEIKQLQQETIDLESECNKRNVDIDVLKSQNEGLKRQIESQSSENSELNQLRQQLLELTEVNNANIVEMRVLKERGEQREEDANRLNITLESANETIKSLQKDILSNERDLDELRIVLHKREMELDEATVLCKQREQEIVILKEKYEAAEKDIEQLNTQQAGIKQIQEGHTTALLEPLQIEIEQLQNKYSAIIKENELIREDYLETLKALESKNKILLDTTENNQKLLEEMSALKIAHEEVNEKLMQKTALHEALLDEFQCSGDQLESLNKENKLLREKVEKMGQLVVAADFEVQFKKLQALAQRMHPTAPIPHAAPAPLPGEGEPCMDESHTDDVKRLQQHLTAMTANITVIENGVTALESNITQWAAALQSRDQLILSLQNQLSEIEQSKAGLERKVEEVMLQGAEWEKRLKEVQGLYETEVGRLEVLCREKDTHIHQLTQPSSIDSADKDTASGDPLINDRVSRLVDENADLKQLVQQLRSNMLEVNTRLGEQAPLPPEQKTRVSPTLHPSSPSSQVTDSQYLTLKEKESSLKKEVERLRAHLVEVEEHYTTESMSMEAELTELRSKLSVAEEQLRSNTTVYKSANVRASQHVDALNTQIQLITLQRNDLQIKLSDAEDQAQKQAAALTSLQLVLEQFQLDKQRELEAAEERHKYQIQLEQRRAAEISQEVESLTRQLAEAKNGLKAGLRLGEQLEHKSRLLADCQQELSNLKDELQAARNQVSSLSLATSGKLDKSLIKNIVLGYLGAHPEQKTQALRILTAVLEFSEEERTRAGLQVSEGGWLSSLLHPHPSHSNNNQSESISQAFVRFLESESRPQPQLRLLPAEPAQPGIRRVEPRRTPLILSELVLPSVTQTPVSDVTLSGVFNEGGES